MGALSFPLQLSHTALGQKMNSVITRSIDSRLRTATKHAEEHFENIVKNGYWINI